MPVAHDIVRAHLDAGVDVAHLEAAIVAAHLAANGAPAPTNDLISGLCADAANHPDLVGSFAGAAPVTVDAVVKCFEVLVPDGEARDHGAVFTPEAITGFMAHHTIGLDNADGTVIDPACGCGALLVAAVRRIHELSGTAPSAIVANQIFGVDISAESLRRARILLALTCVDLGDDVAHIDDNLTCGDALDRDLAPFGDVTFDVVLANPPYVRFQHIDVARRVELSDAWPNTLSKGNFNLYFAFFELAETLCGTGGVVGYITPNSWFTAMSAGPLRRWMADTGMAGDLVDFGHTRVFDAMTYTTITFGRPGVVDRGVSYTRIDDLDLLDGWAAPSGDRYVRDELSTTRPWRLVSSGDRAAIRRIADTGVPLGELADIRFGVATLRDRLYIVDGSGEAPVASRDGRCWPIEAGATRALLRVPDLADDDAVAASTTRIIYPYDLVDGSAVVWSEEKLRDEFPLCAVYLDSVAGELAQRDRGRKTYAAWFAYGRTQGLVPPGGERLLTPLYAGRPRFLRDRSGDALVVNGCSVRPKDPQRWPIDRLAVVLNSAVCRWFIESTATSIDGGFFSYQKTQISPFGVLELTDADIATMEGMSVDDLDVFLADRYGIGPVPESPPHRR